MVVYELNLKTAAVQFKDEWEKMITVKTIMYSSLIVLTISVHNKYAYDLRD